MVSLIVQMRSRAVNVFFVIDTGSPFTYLSPSTYKALGFNENVPETASVIIHGCLLAVSLSPPGQHFPDVNVLGASYLLAIGASVLVNYNRNTPEVSQVVISRP